MPDSIDQLNALCRGLSPISTEDSWWGRGSSSISSSLIPSEGIHLKVDAYLTQRPLPPDLVTSVRCVVCRHGEILVVQDRSGFHIVPGGRREPGESLAQTARREVLEETGWLLGKLVPLGFLHFHHLTPRPAGHPYPYPDFLQLLYLAQATEYTGTPRGAAVWELDSRFRPIAEVNGLKISAYCQAFLNAASAILEGHS